MKNLLKEYKIPTFAKTTCLNNIREFSPVNSETQVHHKSPNGNQKFVFFTNLNFKTYKKENDVFVEHKDKNGTWKCDKGNLVLTYSSDGHMIKYNKEDNSYVEYKEQTQPESAPSTQLTLPVWAKCIQNDSIFSKIEPTNDSKKVKIKDDMKYEYLFYENKSFILYKSNDIINNGKWSCDGNKFTMQTINGDKYYDGMWESARKPQSSTPVVKPVEKKPKEETQITKTSSPYDELM
jgi:hypothetical protein